MAQTAIAAAEAGDYSEVQRLLTLLQHPFSDEDADIKVKDITSSHTCHQVSGVSGDGLAYDMKPPTWAAQLKVS
jgi:hypothetical protein